MPTGWAAASATSSPSACCPDPRSSPGVRRAPAGLETQIGHTIGLQHSHSTVTAQSQHSHSIATIQSQHSHTQTVHTIGLPASISMPQPWPLRRGAAHACVGHGMVTNQAEAKSTRRPGHAAVDPGVRIAQRHRHGWLKTPGLGVRHTKKVNGAALGGLKPVLGQSDLEGRVSGVWGGEVASECVGELASG